MKKRQLLLLTVAISGAYFMSSREHDITFVSPALTEQVDFTTKTDQADFDEVITIKRKYAEQVGLPEDIGL